MGLTYAQKFIGGMLTILGVTIVVDTSAMVLAHRSDDGMVVENYYEHELNFAAEKDHTANPQGWQATFQAPQTARQPGTVVVTLRDRAQHPVTGASVTLDFFRPTKAGFDQTLLLKEVQPGRFESRVTLPLVGIWDTHLHLGKGADRLDLHQRIHVEAARS